MMGRMMTQFHGRITISYSSTCTFIKGGAKLWGSGAAVMMTESLAKQPWNICIDSILLQPTSILNVINVQPTPNMIYVKATHEKPGVTVSSPGLDRKYVRE